MIFNKMFSAVLGVTKCWTNGFSALQRMCALYFSSCFGGLQWGPFAAPKMDPSRPWRRQVEPKCPPWMQQSVERLEKKRLESIAANRKRERHMSDEEEGDPCMFLLFVTY